MSIIRYIRACWKYNLILLFWIFLGQGISVFWGIKIANLTTSLSESAIYTIIENLVSLTIIVLLWSIQIYMEEKSFSCAIENMNIQIREDVTNRIISAGYRLNFEKDSGTFVSWLTNDINIINQDGFWKLRMITKQIIGITFSLFAVIYFHYSLVVVIMILSFFMVVIPRMFAKKMKKSMRELSEATDITTTNISDVFLGLDDLLMMNLDSYIVNRVFKASQKLKTKKMEYAINTGLMYSVTNGVSILSQILLLACSGFLFLNSSVPIGAISGIQYFSAEIFRNLSGLNVNITRVQTIQSIFDKFMEISPIKNINKNKVLKLESSIELKNVSFSYSDDSNQILKNISITIKKGKKYSIIAESGRGKSTILNLLSGKHEKYNGEIYWDGIPYSELEMFSIREQIIYINQQPRIFKASIKDNIILNKYILPEELDEVIEKVGLKKWINTLENGLDTLIDFEAKNISGGQRQRIALARGLIQEKKIVFLDEVTSSLDEESAKEIECMILKQTNLTVLMVTHHISKEVENMIDTTYFL